MQTAIRNILPGDNKTLAHIIRATLTEFGAAHPGTVYYDSTTDHLYELFQREGSVYFVALEHDQVVGGAGIFPSSGLPEGTCELVKMYLLPVARNKGLGGKLISACLDWAHEYGYSNVYLETMPELSSAVKIYEQFGFEKLDAPVGNTGHFGCEIWMLKKF
jgi:putative acetyltransferase